MKKLIYSTLMLLFSVTVSFAQKGEDKKMSDEQRAERSTNRLQEQLSLTNDQKAKVKQLELDKIKKTQEWRKTDMDARKGVNETRMAYMKNSNQQLEQVLTPAQKEKFTTLKKEQRSKMSQRRGPGAGPGRDRMDRGPKGKKDSTDRKRDIRPERRDN